MTWCLKQLARKKIPKKKLKEIYKSILTWSHKNFPSNGKFRVQDLQRVIEKIDNLWFQNKLIQEIKDNYDKFELLTHSKEDSELRIGGWVSESTTRKKITLFMNQKLYTILFTEGSKGYHAGGLVCNSKFLCFLHVLLHELVHIILSICDKQGHRPDEKHHSKEFQKMVLHLFGHTSPKHGLIYGYSQTLSLAEIIKRIKRGVKAEAFVNGTWIYGEIMQVTNNKVTIKELQTSNYYSIEYGLLRFPKK